MSFSPSCNVRAHRPGELEEGFGINTLDEARKMAAGNISDLAFYY
jgi:hypothetical protein